LGAVLASECSDLQDAGLKVSYECGPEVTMRCHPDALARAVRNLVENANRYADGAVVELTSGEGVVEIVISDHGPGISEDQIELALKPFGRLSNARESHQGGFGLGLAIVQAIARGHGGELKFASNDPTGLVASIELPVPE
jgi:signal transduction histidine kinase